MDLRPRTTGFSVHAFADTAPEHLPVTVKTALARLYCRSGFLGYKALAKVVARLCLATDQQRTSRLFRYSSCLTYQRDVLAEWYSWRSGIRSSVNLIRTDASGLLPNLFIDDCFLFGECTSQNVEMIIAL